MKFIASIKANKINNEFKEIKVNKNIKKIST